VTLDQQQALLIAVLRQADGKPVRYSELRDAGVEYPASVVSELELAGVALERCYEGPLGARRLLGVRLAPGDAAAIYGSEGDEPTSALRAERDHKRWLAPVALVAVAATVLAMAVGGHNRAGSAHRNASRLPSRASTAEPRAGHIPTARRSPLAATSQTQGSPALAAQLEGRGHELLQAGELAGAVPILKQALAATGETLDSCLEPVSETCLTYAYALYDLGTALRLARKPGAAVPILEHRLQIANQRSTVQSQLELARREAGRGVPIAPTAG
jgi:hypothetical protein